ncbi:MAG: hypothetical protein BWY99_02335 [Synergistetes bacterium ADurb.BinA166]|nr:MAG: hypothetical protein BWY99_02335 [Synergistetes bacterium ADurb.BinA166]
MGSALTTVFVDVIWAGQSGRLPHTVAVSATDGDVRQWVTEAIRAGTVSGMPADATANLRDFVVDRFPALGTKPWRIRPKTLYGS